MGPGLAIHIRNWPPPQLPALKQHLATRAATFSVRLSDHRPGEEWHLQLPGDVDAPEISIALRPVVNPDPEAEAALGWKPQGYVELYGFKRPDLRPTIREMVEIACLIAERLGGVVVLEDDTYVTAEEYRKVSGEPGFAVSGFPAA